MKVDRAGIERLIPHAGSMCLVDTVAEWSEAAITCTGAAPAAGHPLAGEHGVPAIAATEYAAQATAVHGALLAPGGRPRAGLLAALMDVQLGAEVIPPDEGALRIDAEMLSRSASGCLYRFDVRTARTTIASGRLMVALVEDAA